MDLSRRNLIRSVGAGTAGGTLTGVAAGVSEETVAGDDFEEREWSYVRSDFEAPGEDLPAVLMVDGYKGASSGESPTSLEEGQRPTHYVRMSDGVLIAVSISDHPLTPDDMALAWASVRGTGCSAGSFDLFDERGVLDGVELIEWLSARGWTLDRVGLFGASYSAILAVHVAGRQPDSLAALCFSAVIGDLYRGAVFPGGVPNPVFPSVWSQAFRPAAGRAGTLHVVGRGDEICAQNAATREPAHPGDHEAVWYTRREAEV